jgi:hypothetical protein
VRQIHYPFNLLPVLARYGPVVTLLTHNVLCYRMSDDEDDPEEKLGDTVRYLQKLGPDHLDVIFEASKWVFEQDKRAGLEVSFYSISYYLHYRSECRQLNPQSRKDLCRRFGGSRIPTTPRRLGSSRFHKLGSLHKLP